MQLRDTMKYVALVNSVHNNVHQMVSWSNQPDQTIELQNKYPNIQHHNCIDRESAWAKKKNHRQVDNVIQKCILVNIEQRKTNIFHHFISFSFCFYCTHADISPTAAPLFKTTIYEFHDKKQASSEVCVEMVEPTHACKWEWE